MSFNIIFILIFNIQIQIFVVDTKIEVLSKNDNLCEVIYGIQQSYYETQWKRCLCIVKQQSIKLKGFDYSEIKIDKNLMIDMYYDDVCIYIIVEKFIFVIKQSDIAVQLLIKLQDSPIQLNYKSLGITKQFVDFQKMNLTQLCQSIPYKNQLENEIFQLQVNLYKEKVDQLIYQYNVDQSVYQDDEKQFQTNIKPSILYYFREKEKQRQIKQDELKLYDEQINICQQIVSLAQNYHIHDLNQYYQTVTIQLTLNSLTHIGFYQFVQKLTKVCKKMTVEQIATYVNKQIFQFYQKIVQENKQIEKLWLQVNSQKSFIIEGYLDPKQTIIRVLVDIMLYYISDYVFYLLDEQYSKENEIIALQSALVSQKDDIYDELEISKENQDPDNFDMIINYLSRIKQFKILSPHKILKVIVDSIQILQITIQKFSLSADELIPLLILIFGRIKLVNYHSFLKFMQLFNCGCLTDEEMNILVHFEFVDNWFLQYGQVP